jgi:hypothetical protein
MVLVQIRTQSGSGDLQACAATSPRRVRSAVPVAGLLHGDDLFEVDGMHQQFGRGKAAEAGAYHLVDEAIVDDRAFEAHSADQTDCLHF